MDKKTVSLHQCPSYISPEKKYHSATCICLACKWTGPDTLRRAEGTKIDRLRLNIYRTLEDYITIGGQEARNTTNLKVWFVAGEHFFIHHERSRQLPEAYWLYASLIKRGTQIIPIGFLHVRPPSKSCTFSAVNYIFTQMAQCNYRLQHCKCNNPKHHMQRQTSLWYFHGFFRS